MLSTTAFGVAAGRGSTTMFRTLAYLRPATANLQPCHKLCRPSWMACLPFSCSKLGSHALTGNCSSSWYHTCKSISLCAPHLPTSWCCGNAQQTHQHRQYELRLPMCQALGRPEQGPQDTPATPQSQSTPATTFLTQPSFSQGINWYCYTMLGFIFLTDFTPLPSILRASGLWAVTALQWTVFFLPTLLWFSQQGWRAGTLLLGPKQPTVSVVAASGVFGAVLFAALSALLRAKAGVDISDLTSVSLPSLEGIAVEQSSSLPAITALTQRPQSLPDLLQLLGLAGISPAICEEMLFRGFLLQALQTPEGPGKPSLGRVDAVFLTGALFAAAHLDLSNFFSLSVLGVTCGGVALATGSVLPAMALHASFNTTALLMGLPS